MTRVLVVEDDVEIRDVLDAVVRSKGYEVCDTASGTEALLALQREPADLVLLDIEIEDLSGLGVQRALRDFSRVPTVVMSSRSQPWQAEAFAAGATACVRKPFDVAALQRLMETLTKRPVPLRGWPDAVQLSDEELSAIGRLPPEELDALPFGAIALDRAGRIVEYNRYEHDATGYERASLLGRRFVEVAPCTRVKRFAGAIEEGFAVGKLDRVLRYIFPYGHARARVTVRLFYDRASERMWIFIARAAVRPQ